MARLAAAVGGGAVLVLGGVGQAQAPAGKTPGFTTAQAIRGTTLYGDNCAMCHGDGLDDGQFAPPLKGKGFADYWQGRTASDMLTYITTMMPPSQPGGLGPQAYADVMAYIIQSGGAAPGTKELPADPAALGSATPF